MKYFEKQGIKWQNGEAPTWLVENYDFVFGEKRAVVSFDGDCLRMGGHGNKLIEVSDLMEDEKMEDYVTINSEALKQIRWGTNYGKFGFIDHDEDGENHVYEQYLPANLEIPKFLVYPKVPMTEAEKKEFDKLKDEMSLDRHDLDDLLTRIKDSEDFPFLYHRLYVADGDGVESQLEFARAWADPDLIEVLPEKKWNVRVPISNDEEFYKKDSTGKVGTVSFVEEHSLKLSDMQFTAEELKQYGLNNDLFEKVEVQE